MEIISAEEQMGQQSCTRRGSVEIEEVEESTRVPEIAAAGEGKAVAHDPGRASTGKAKDDDEDVYVAVGKGESSRKALLWALTTVARPWSFVYLIHVFPEIHHIPTPLGMLPKEQVSQAQVDSYKQQEKVKITEMLQKFSQLCQNFELQCDIILVESDQIIKAVVDLIPVLNIKRLIVGTSKANLRRPNRGKAGQIHKNAPDYCKVKIICDESEVAAPDQSIPSSPSSEAPDDDNDTDGETVDKTEGTASCGCFSRKLL